MEIDRNDSTIAVAIRCRPLNDKERTEKIVFTCNHEMSSIAQLNSNDQPIAGQTFNFDHVFSADCTTSAVYTGVARKVVKEVTNGVNGTIFAYGQTNSGKTYTMLGRGDKRGVLEMAFEDVFQYVASLVTRTFSMKLSFIEIYNEKVRDLLADAEGAFLTVREDPNKGVFCDATEVPAVDYDSVMLKLREGLKRRAIESNGINDTSSRSHTIFRLVVDSHGDISPSLSATLTLVDLAGSESVRHTDAQGQRLKEGANINRSLLSLSNVIRALSNRATAPSTQGEDFVNYRDSKLTLLLKPSLCGNARMAIICCITPTQKYVEETRSTLMFAKRAKFVKTNAKVNEVIPNDIRYNHPHYSSHLSSHTSFDVSSYALSNLSLQCMELP